MDNIFIGESTFTPLILSTSSGWGPSATFAFKRLAGLIVTKHGQPYSTALRLIRCKIGFSLIQSGIVCLRGPRSSFHAPAKAISLEERPLDLIHQEVCLFDWHTHDWNVGYTVLGYQPENVGKHAAVSTMMHQSSSG